MKHVKRALIIILSVLAVWCIAIFVTARFGFHYLPDDAVVCKAKVDEYGLFFLITEDHELYIGGSHTDAMGLYDIGSGRWGIPFDCRLDFHSRENGAPVRFAEDVIDVFPERYGFTYLDTSGNLYSFFDGARRTLIAEDVKKAASVGRAVLYQNTKGEVYLIPREDIHTSIPVAEDAADIYYDSTGVIRVLMKDGTICSTTSYHLDRRTEITIPDYVPGMPIHHNDVATTYLSPDHTLYRHLWEDETDTDWHVIAADVAFDDLKLFSDVYLTTDGKLVQYNSDLEDITSSMKTIATVNPDGVVKLECCYNFAVALYEDGHYQFIGLDRYWAGKRA